MKFIREHCSICGEELAMPVVREESERLIWVSCPHCHEIKPIEISPARKAREIESEPLRHPRRVIRHYRAGERFLTGEWIYHSEWDDTGQIIEKKTSNGGREIIVVSFEKVGTKRLISNFAR